MSENGIDTRIIGACIAAASDGPMMAETAAGLSLELNASEALRRVKDGDDPNALIGDVLTVAAHTVATIIMACHKGHLCAGCMAKSVYSYSLDVSGELAGYRAVSEPDETPSEIPPFSGSIN